MKLTVVGGLTIFFAILAIAITGVPKDLNAAWRSHGGHRGLFGHHRCHGAVSTCGGGWNCGGGNGGCRGWGHHRHGGLFGHRRANRCSGGNGYVNASCCGNYEVAYGCGGATIESSPVPAAPETVAPEDAAPTEAPPDVPPAPST